MAHIGKIYKVLFRRDLCLACTNFRNAFPEAWRGDITIEKLFGGGGVETIDAGNLTPTEPASSNAPRWESAPTTLFGKPCTVVIRWSRWEFPLQTTRIFYELYGSVGLVLQFEPRQQVVGRCGHYVPASGFGDVVTVADPAWWGGSAVRWTGDIRGATWDQYNP